MRYRISQIPVGRGATAASLQEMVRLVRNSLLFPETRQLALEIAGIIGVVTQADYVRAVDHWVRNHIRMIDEPDEILTDPVYMIHRIAEAGFVWEDCDGSSLLTASLLAVAGIQVRFKAILERPDGSFGHVFTEFLHGLKWRAIDTTLEYAAIYSGASLTFEV